MKPRKPDETDAQYIARLEARNAGLKKRNDELTKWGSALNEAVTALATDGSLVFQAMAEKAGVRSHPSVVEAVRLFDSISHPQWHEEGKKHPRVEWPSDWELDEPGAWSGDADMQLNAPIAEAIEMLDEMKFSVSGKTWEALHRIMVKLHEATRKPVEGIKDRAGFTTRQITRPATEHFRQMSAAELCELVEAMSWMALDLAQDMDFANQMLRRDLRAAAYRRIHDDLYGLASLDTNPAPGPINIKVLGDVFAS